MRQGELSWTGFGVLGTKVPFNGQFLEHSSPEHPPMQSIIVPRVIFLKHLSRHSSHGTRNSGEGEGSFLTCCHGSVNLMETVSSLRDNLLPKSSKSLERGNSGQHCKVLQFVLKSDFSVCPDLFLMLC